MRVLLIVNPSARHGNEKRDLAIELLKKCNIEIQMGDKVAPPKYSELIIKERANVDAVVIAGGDGSVHFALSGLLETGLPLGIFPMGTANNLARNLNIATDLEGACKIISTGHIKDIDVAMANGVPFINVAGIGLSTQVNQQVPREAKHRFGPFAYAYYAFRVARRMRPFKLRLLQDNQEKVLKTLQVTVCNGKFYGTGLSIAKDAEITDGKLDLMSVEVEGFWQGLKLIPAFFQNRAEEKYEVKMYQGSKFTLRAKRAMHVDLDGEIRTRTPVEFAVLPKALKMFVPEETIPLADQ